VAQLSRCEVLTAPVGELIAPLAVMLGELSIREQLPQIEVAVADNATALVLRVLATPSAADLARLREFAAAHRLRLYLQPGGLDSVRELEPAGEPCAGSLDLGARARLRAREGRRGRHVSAHGARGIARAARSRRPAYRGRETRRMSLGPLMIDLAGTSVTAEDRELLHHPLV